MSDDFGHVFQAPLFGDGCMFPKCGRTADSPRHIAVVEPPLVRALDCATSIAAAKFALLRAGTNRHRCLDALVHAGERGLTDFELEDATGLKQTSCGKRRGELVVEGYVEKTDVRRDAPSGVTAIVWRATTAGREKAAQLRDVAA